MGARFKTEGITLKKGDLTVSYTHLDVYKRQAPSSSTRPRVMKKASGTPRRPRPASVSYTHLMVAAIDIGREGDLIFAAEQHGGSGGSAAQGLAGSKHM